MLINMNLKITKRHPGLMCYPMTRQLKVERKNGRTLRFPPFLSRISPAACYHGLRPSCVAHRSQNQLHEIDTTYYKIMYMLQDVLPQTFPPQRKRS